MNQENISEKSWIILDLPAAGNGIIPSESEDLGDRKTVEQQALDPRTIEYTDKNQATAVHHFPTSEVAPGTGKNISGWWFGTFFIYFYILRIIIPID